MSCNDSRQIVPKVQNVLAVNGSYRKQQGKDSQESGAEHARNRPADATAEDLVFNCGEEPQGETLARYVEPVAGQ